MNIDRKSIVVIALCVAFLLFYRPLLKLAGLERYVEPSKPAATQTTGPTAGDSATGDAAGESGSVAPEPAAPAPQAPATAAPAAGGETVPSLSAGLRPAEPVLQRTEAIETPYYIATFDNRGARLVSVQLKRYASSRSVDANGEHYVPKPGRDVPEELRVSLSGGPLFGLDLGSGEHRRSLAQAVYAVEESLDAAGQRRALTFTFRDSSGLVVRQTYRVRPESYGLDLAVSFQNVPTDWRITEYSLVTRSWPLLTEADLPADTRGLRATSLVGSNVHREGAHGLQKGPKHFEGAAEWAVVQSRYFMAGAVVSDGVARGVESSGEKRLLTAGQLAMLPPRTQAEQEVAINTLIMALPEGRPSDRFLVYAGPSEFTSLAHFDVELERGVDLGWNWIRPFSKVLLQVLNWIFGIIRNYGFAIIILATLVRVLLHPLNAMSMKSMRAMQKVQPEMERIREKYKNDPQAMNTAVMALYKEHKINPAGGCLPMLMQMPLFLALYQVLFNAIELRQAPFVLWMTDLSAPDQLFAVAGFPIRVLPILMSGSGLLQMRLTPTDPRQAPTMYMMNVVMLVFFYNLPSGLVLYWTVMNLMTALQQWMMLRSEKEPASAAVVVETPGKGKKGKGRS